MSDPMGRHYNKIFNKKITCNFCEEPAEHALEDEAFCADHWEEMSGHEPDPIDNFEPNDPRSLA